MVRRNFNILADSEYCIRLITENSDKGRCTKELICRIWRGLALVQRMVYVSIGWTKAHSSTDTPDALGYAAADQLVAARGCTGRFFLLLVSSVVILYGSQSHRFRWGITGVKWLYSRLTWRPLPENRMVSLVN